LKIPYLRAFKGEFRQAVKEHGGLRSLDTFLVGEHNSLPKHHPQRTKLRTRHLGEPLMRGSTSTLKEYTVEESLTIFREAGFAKLEMARGRLLLCKTHELRQSSAAHGEELGLSTGVLKAVGENYFEPFGTDELKHRSPQAMKGDMDMALSLGTTDMMIREGDGSPVRAVAPID